MQICSTRVNFVGHIIGSGLHSPNPTKVACVQTIKHPVSNKEVRQVLEFFSHLQTYIDTFAETAKPLTDLTKKQVSNKMSWTSEHQHAFDSLKQSLCNATKLLVFELANLVDC